MAEGNLTMWNEFILLGLTDRVDLQVALFLFFLMAYIVTVVGNLGMTMLIKIEPQLHTPMYFFLSNLSFVDFCYSSCITPRMLMTFLSETKAISFIGCASQAYSFGAFATTEVFLLAVMAYDRYVAICHPLLYRVIVSPRVCVVLVSITYFGAFANSLIHTYLTFRLSFCQSNVINNFFCEIPLMLQLSCSDTSINFLLMFICATFNSLSTLWTILISYICILAAILRAHSREGKQKAFSTCASHLTAVFILYGTLIIMYLQPHSNSSLNQNGLVSMFYTVFIPLLNPLIYSLRNKEVKSAFRKVMEMKVLSLVFDD
ncbi:olfactory receptor 1020-like [Tachyglossus aculeatus]|uniref:olfactory receptor 1020-like n=1 Tax=Tachyglossus aculeatus TaxID=9261 RepID=UPI0018F402DF|nr:olfactory receptor 1020-like [Tachyglossus aculeatus]